MMRLLGAVLSFYAALVIAAEEVEKNRRHLRSEAVQDSEHVDVKGDHYDYESEDQDLDFFMQDEDGYAEIEDEVGYFFYNLQESRLRRLDNQNPVEAVEELAEEMDAGWVDTTESWEWQLEDGDPFPFPFEIDETLTYKTTQEGELKLDIYYPDSEPTGPYPVVVFTHGGGWTTGSRHHAQSLTKGKAVAALIERGFCVVSVQYRLIDEHNTRPPYIRDCVIDAKDAMRFLAKNAETYHLDHRRFFTFGDSAGGQIAQMLLLSPSDTLLGDADLYRWDESYTLRAGVSWYGPSDFEKTELMNWNDDPDFVNRFIPRICGARKADDCPLGRVREVSPVQYLEPNSPPLLLIHGDGDETIPIKQAYYMKNRANEIGARVETMYVKNAGHNWKLVEDEMQIEPTKDEIVRATVAFLADHCPGKLGDERWEENTRQ